MDSAEKIRRAPEVGQHPASGQRTEAPKESAPASAGGHNQEGKEAAMKWPGVMQAGEIEKFARFLDEHPCFSPELAGEYVLVLGFRLGECFLTMREMERLLASPPQVDEQPMTVRRSL